VALNFFTLAEKSTANCGAYNYGKIIGHKSHQRNLYYKNNTNNIISFQYAQSLPQRLFEEMPIPEEWVKIKMFKKCKKMHKMQTCMNNDIKKKLEENFGPLSKLVDQTGLPEKHLLPMAMKLLHGDMDMME
jgi:hypothetical protein